MDEHFQTNVWKGLEDLNLNAAVTVDAGILCPEDAVAFDQGLILGLGPFNGPVAGACISVAKLNGN